MRVCDVEPFDVDPRDVGNASATLHDIPHGDDDVGAGRAEGARGLEPDAEMAAGHDRIPAAQLGSSTW
jgi:hypothetical protein